MAPHWQPKPAPAPLVDAPAAPALSVEAAMRIMFDPVGRGKVRHGAYIKLSWRVAIDATSGVSVAPDSTMDSRTGAAARCEAAGLDGPHGGVARGLRAWHRAGGAKRPLGARRAAVGDARLLARVPPRRREPVCRSALLDGVAVSLVSCSQANAPAASRSPRAPSRRHYLSTASRRRRSTRRRPSTSPSKRRWRRSASLVSSPRTSRRRRMSGGTRRGCTSAPGSGPRSSPRGTRRSSICFSRGLIAHMNITGKFYASRFATDARKNAPRCWPLGPTEECVDAGDDPGDSPSERVPCEPESRLKLLPFIQPVPLRVR